MFGTKSQNYANNNESEPYKPSLALKKIHPLKYVKFSS